MKNYIKTYNSVSIQSSFSLVLVCEGPGVSFTSESVCLQASQTCCDVHSLLQKDIPKLNFLFYFLDGGGGEGLERR